MTRTLRFLFAVFASATVASVCAQAPSDARPAGPIELFRSALPDMPGKQLVVVALTIPPRRADQPPSMGHRHPGSVYVYVTEGTARFGIEGQPVKEIKAGESFFEPPGSTHLVSENASTTEPASLLAVIVAPPDETLTTMGQRK